MYICIRIHTLPISTRAPTAIHTNNVMYTHTLHVQLYRNKEIMLKKILAINVGGSLR